MLVVFPRNWDVPSGRFGSLPGLNSSQCVGACSAGYFCTPGSTSPTPDSGVCTAGQWSGGGSGTCLMCPIGRFGASSGAQSSECSGTCAGGRFGWSSGLVTSMCSGGCGAGFYCPPGSTSPTAIPCSVGQYSVGNSSTCTMCPVGRVGSSSGLNSSLCSGLCDAGEELGSMDDFHFQ